LYLNDKSAKTYPPTFGGYKIIKKISILLIGQGLALEYKIIEINNPNFVFQEFPSLL
jgi:hypothetical protein